MAGVNADGATTETRNKEGTKKEDDMPGRDGTGPTGQGPMTGRAMGQCDTDATDDLPKKGGRGRGRGDGRGRGRGRGCGNGGGRGQRRRAGRQDQPGVVVEPSFDSMNQQALALEQTLIDLQERLKRLEETEDGNK